MFAALFAAYYSWPPQGPIGVLFWVAVIAIVFWACYALLTWSGMLAKIPYPVKIVGIALICILLIIVMFKLFEALL